VSALPFDPDEIWTLLQEIGAILAPGYEAGTLPEWAGSLRRSARSAVRDIENIEDEEVVP